MKDPEPGSSPGVHRDPPPADDPENRKGPLGDPPTKQPPLQDPAAPEQSNDRASMIQAAPQALA